MAEIITKVKAEVSDSLSEQIAKLTEDKTRLENSIRANTAAVKQMSIKITILTKLKNSI